MATAGSPKQHPAVESVMTANPALPVGVFQVGGALWDDSPAYVRRRADDELMSALVEQQFCYVLNARQMGKSSLRVQATKALRKRGVQAEMVDLSTLQGQVERDWYWAFIGKLAGALKLQRSAEFERLRSVRDDLAGAELLGRFIDEVLLGASQHELVVFIDEIDSTLNLPFSVDGFFATLRECHELRPLDQRYRRLTFVLIGVAQSDELARDHRTTPFNVARGIDLSGFALEEMGPLRAQLPEVLRCDAVIARMLHWTGGQPFLTHKLCELLAKNAGTSELNPAELVGLVDRCVTQNVVSKWEENDNPEHLRTIRKRMDGVFVKDQRLATRILHLYERVLESELDIEAERTGAELELRLTGLVVLKKGRLASANRIYREVFGADWVQSQLKRLRPYDEAFSAWKRSERSDVSRLLSGDALREAQKWADGRPLVEDEREFLRTSEARVEGVRARLLAGAIVTAALLLAGLLVSLGLYASLAKNSQAARDNFARANREAEEAKKQATRATAETERANRLATAAQQSEAQAKEESERANEQKRLAVESEKRAEAETLRANDQTKVALEAVAGREKETQRALKAEAEAKVTAARVQAESQKLSVNLAACTLVDQDRARLRAELDTLKKQCPAGAAPGSAAP